MLFKMYSRVGDAILHDNFYLPTIIFTTFIFIIFSHNNKLFLGEMLYVTLSVIDKYVIQKEVIFLL